MKITIIEANSDLGVKVDGANLGPHILSEHFKDKFDVVKVDKGNFTKNKEENNKCRNLEAVNDFDERLRIANIFEKLTLCQTEDLIITEDNTSKKVLKILK